MPTAAIFTGVVDHVLPPEAIATEVERTAEQVKESTDLRENGSFDSGNLVANGKNDLNA